MKIGFVDVVSNNLRLISFHSQSLACDLGFLRHEAKIKIDLDASSTVEVYLYHRLKGSKLLSFFSFSGVQRVFFEYDPRLYHIVYDVVLEN